MSKYVDAVRQSCRPGDAHRQLALVQQNDLTLGQRMASMGFDVAGGVRLRVAGQAGVSVVSSRSTA